MSARYSNTSSRGREIVVETVIGSTGGSLCRHPLVDDPDRVAELGPVDEPRALRRAILERDAQLAHEASLRTVIDLLAGEQRPPAVGAAVAGGGEVVARAPQQDELEPSGLQGRGVFHELTSSAASPELLPAAPSPHLSPSLWAL